MISQIFLVKIYMFSVMYRSDKSLGENVGKINSMCAKSKSYPYENIYLDQFEDNPKGHKCHVTRYCSEFYIENAGYIKI